MDEIQILCNKYVTGYGGRSTWQGAKEDVLDQLQWNQYLNTQMALMEHVTNQL